MNHLWSVMKTFAGIFVEMSPQNKPVSNSVKTGEHFNRIALSTWLVMLAGIIVLFGFKTEIVEPVVKRVLGRDCHVSCYASWELGALVWNAVFAIYFYLKVPTTDHVFVEKFTPVAVFLVGGFTVMALFSLVSSPDERGAAQHVFYVLLISLVFLVMDGIHARKQKERRKRMEFEQCLLLADLPMVPALAVLYYYQQSRTVEFDKVDIFLSGAISFQLIASTLIFACIQAGVFNHVFARWFRDRTHTATAPAR